VAEFQEGSDVILMLVSPFRSVARSVVLYVAACRGLYSASGWFWTRSCA